MKTSTILRRACLETLEQRRLLSFGPAATYPAGTLPAAVATADLNGDTRGDLVTANATGNNVSVLLSNANGTFQAPQNFATGVSPRSVAVGDFNTDTDTKVDVVTANVNEVSVLLGNGNGTLQAAQSIVLPGQLPPGYTGGTPLAQSPGSVAVGDLNKDGKMDLAVTGRTTFQVTVSGYYGDYTQTFTHDYVNVLLGNGSGAFTHTSATLNVENNQIIGTVALGHFNDDTKLDVMTANAGDVSVLLGNGDGTLKAPLRSGSASGAASAIGDVDNDGNLDILLSNVLLKGRGDGTFESKAPLALGSIRSIVLGDVNTDGKIDLVANTFDFRYTTYGYYGGYDPVATDYTKVLLGYGDGSFASPISATLGSHPGFNSPPNAAALGHFNGDTEPDLAATEPGGGSVVVQLNQADWILPAAVRIDDVTVTEGNSGTTNAVFNVTITPGDEPNASVDYTTFDGGARVIDGDYQATSGTLSFTAGQTSKTITVPVNGDRIGELDESFFINLTSGPGADLVNAQGLGTILDDEPRIEIDNPSVIEGDSGTKSMTFTTTLSAASDQPVSVKYATLDFGSAKAGKDYNSASGTLTFAPGQTSRTITVQIKGDLTAEYDDQFLVELTDATNALIVNNAGLGTIEDNDPDPTITITNVSRSEGDVATKSFDFIVSLSKPTEKYVYVEYETANGTATDSGNNRDYRDEYDELYFDPGEPALTITVRVNGDTRIESDETFFVNLTYADGATFADDQGVGTIVNDDGVAPPPAPSPGKVSIVTDPSNNSKTAVKIEGTDSADTIAVTKSGSSQGKAVVKINGATKGAFSFTGSILVYGKNGNDNISIDGAITRSALIFGGDGKDTANGGGGADALVGNAGNDNLKGNAGRDLLIGGDGADKLDGGGSDDILVAGRTPYDNDASKLWKLLDEWNRTDKGYSTRSSHLINGGGLNGSVKLNPGNIFSSAGLKDSMTGGGSNDLFFAVLPGDLLTDKTSGEKAVDVG